MEKVERLISIIMILLKKDLVSATEFAQLFHVSKRTILRDMETLSLSNIPIYAIHGIHGGYGILDAYKVDKRLLNSADLENILTALSGFEQILLTEEVKVTLKKIEAMVSPAFPKRSIHFSFYDWAGRSELLYTLQICQEAIAKLRLIAYDYIDKHGNTTNRLIEPYQLHFSESSWYLKGFCLQRQEYRTFKLSRIDQLQMEEATFLPRHDGAQQEPEADFQPQLVTITVLLSPAIKDQFIERFGRKSMEAYNAEYFLSNIQIPRNPIGFRFLLSFGAELEIVGPANYVEEFHHYVNEIARKYV
ncbi:YafY family transcriptional regulator [Paenibacillus athensensis]|uniref:Transcriptional regulator n=1 Tax=Paenibacillus athensensis TaxID=1967502 RepID=A0A4Y8Q4W9_9BACL|nr:YafY family protein [Paenibacillus athensensis]MCD1258370.1 YafY family transcriptional regulator [Paenibacillus athensensis]